MDTPKATSKHAGWQTTAKERLSYYIGYSGIASQNAVISSYFSVFILMTGVNLNAIAIVTLIIKGIDAIDDIIFGFLVDKIKLGNSRFSKLVGQGNYLPWLRAFFLLLPLTTIALFNMPGNMSDGMKILWFSVGYLLWDLSYTMIDIPSNAIVTTMTSNGDERNVIIAQRGFPHMFMVVITASIATVLINENVGFSIGTASIILSVALLPTIIPAVLGVREHSTKQSDLEEKYTFKDMLAYIKGNRYLAMLFGGYMIKECLNTGAGVWLFVAFYLFHNSLFSLLYYISAVISLLIILILVPTIARKFNKGTVMRIMVVGSILTGTFVYLGGYHSMPLHVGLYLLHIFVSGFAGVMINFACLDCAEYGKYKTGIDGTGVAFAMQSFAIKMTGAIASALGIFFLGLFYWVPVEASDFAELAAMGVTQTEQALNGLWIVSMGIPVIGIILCAITWFRYNLRDKDVALMIRFNKGEITREEADSQMSRSY